MRRREFIAPFGASVTWRFAALAQQQAGRPYRLGYLGAPRSDAVVPVFLEAMRRLGFIEGQNLTVITARMRSISTSCRNGRPS